MALNFNVGLLGHVDSGKTTLAEALSTCASTAAFDKSPQSREREITLDLGFSGFTTAMPEHLRSQVPEEQLQFTFVDCPGHASLIRTIISGAQIIDLMVLVIDAQKGVQTQTAECIVIGEILQRKLVVVVNKIDLLAEASRTTKLQQLHTRLRKTLEKTTFGGDVTIFDVSAKCASDIQTFRDRLCEMVYVPNRCYEAPLVIYADHCFSIKGQGTICTGTVMQGRVAVNDTIEIPAIGLQRKVKSIQMFRRATQSAATGDRVGLCVTQFNPKLLERGLLTRPQYLQCIYATCIRLQRIQYYKSSFKSGGKFHYTLAHKTVTGKVTLFKSNETTSFIFDPQKEYEYLECLDDEVENQNSNSVVFALIEFDVPIFAVPEAIVIASNLDMDKQMNQCRLAFWGMLQWCTHLIDYKVAELPKFKIFKWKFKQGSVARVIDTQNIIVDKLFAKIANREIYIGKQIQLASGECGIIESTFGQTSKVRVHFRHELAEEIINQLRAGGRNAETTVELRLKKYIYNKSAGLKQ